MCCFTRSKRVVVCEAITFKSLKQSIGDFVEDALEFRQIQVAFFYLFLVGHLGVELVLDAIGEERLFELDGRRLHLLVDQFGLGNARLQLLLVVLPH